MATSINGFIDRLRPKQYSRKQPLVLINGLAEQAESWYRNFKYWRRFFEVHAPNILAFEGEALQRRVAAKEPISVEYLVRQLHTYLDQFVQTPPYHIVSSSLGGKVAVEFAAQYPQLVSRLILICPSGMGDEEKLPIMEGVVGRDALAVVKSVFHKPRLADRDMLRYYKSKFASRRWKTGFLKTVRGTLDHTVRERLKDVKCPALLVTAAHDKICCPRTAEEAAKDLPHGHFLKIEKCGHAPQIEKASKINRLVVHFLSSPTPTARPSWTQLLLVKPTQRPTA
ncbi:alpha beta hydrolase : Putative hydrolase or acyltransferase of alpha/beta superfamily OS=Singulisphaera acidiphila (strain ATCC BAA-1392 / DSM 18658 / VKM B-2454 / MOB10) GN=Sinac_1601 PE=4 SV=1: Abhydrolase_6 [Gemmataceae bacterium]|nr:alpha beta hydrolase : Putative hydrolase or acyltransferase of alpha/beta superfamily OS=Singulisphaera acidiphila (strain ATCC BAA-1392 / DSM 18658 / VKM B-2454 / MOB10) GN=Sinac_1601 PE=4 SV=1: Abhydrolase_6 [Gemmataceae bacterium]VTT97058.1 alpha beta hydrolase : Putative hydrolase or acyltransferase of alpha/beta superfamily OS=Singulisphaera acidiphila (strain ATCC BAA-1392 / DSM 18658 / VKM B-2454 / MOB10) GN=Sinac_1601 PE=4 SV=1: Abhydrolase_6 [Gemmataceae bacterium]